MPADITVFISYSHDSDEHELDVRSLAHQLRADGINAVIDQYQIVPPDGWPLWMEKQIRDSDYVLCVCTETYLRRVMKEETRGKGLGVLWESSIIYAYLYGAGVANEKFIPIVFNHADTQNIPVPLQPTTYYEPRTHIGYEKLYRRLTNQPETPAPPLGSRRVLPYASSPDFGLQHPIALRPNLVHPYPLQANFTGRANERQELTGWLLDDVHPICALTAMGGMGKSALTWYWLTVDVLPQIEGLNSLALEGIMWWSFYEGESSFAKLIDEALEYVSNKPIDTKQLPTSYDRAQELRKELKKKRVLIVLDGFERQLRAYATLDAAYKEDDTAGPSQDGRACVDPVAARWISDVATGPTRAKVLITTRLMIRDLEDRSGTALAGVLQRELVGLPSDDAVEFMRAQGVTRGTAAEIRTMCQAYGNHPLSLRLLSGLISRDVRTPGDIAAAVRRDVHSDLVRRQHHILEQSYEALAKRGRALLSRIAAFRGPMTYDALLVFNTLGSERRFEEVLEDLRLRGFLQHDIETRRYDLHPIVRHYAYDRLADKTGVHTRLRDYFAKIAVPDKDQVQNIEELGPVIELYHHMVRARRHDEAVELLRKKLVPDPLFYRFGAYQLMLELLLGLFAPGEEMVPLVKDKSLQGWALSTLGLAYMFTGQLPPAMLALLASIEHVREFPNAIWEKNLSRAEHSVAVVNLMMGELKMSEMTIQSSINLCNKMKDSFWEAAGRVELGHILTYMGKFDEAESEFELARPVISKLGPSNTNYVSIIPAYSALKALLMGQAAVAVDEANKAKTLAEEVATMRHPYERDFIQAEWLLGAALTMVGEDFDAAAAHLSNALTRCRRINLVELEPDILLAWAKWHRALGKSYEAQSYADEALLISDRCRYRLKQAEAHNFLGYLARERLNLVRAREHAEIAKERAWCNGPSHTYKSALDGATKLLKSLNGRP